MGEQPDDDHREQEQAGADGQRPGAAALQSLARRDRLTTGAVVLAHAAMVLRAAAPVKAPVGI